ncbi:MAG TPA: tetratricopeptide repeat protein [Phycisphaerales bacterium]|nr:tetratricopeptide repeat protein [Phycisphaerales bacterium]
MLFIKQINKTVFFCVIGLLLLIILLFQPSKQEVLLDASLKKHFGLIHDGETGSARVRLRQFMDSNGESSQSLFLMGLSYHSEKRYAKAVEWLEQSVSTQKDIYPPSWHYLGWSHFYLGNGAQANDAFEQYLVIQPDEPDTIFALGLLAMEEGEFESAEELFGRVVQITAQSRNRLIRAKASARLADVQVELGRLDSAILLYNDALGRNPDLYEAWHRLATVLQRVGREEEALTAFSESESARNRIRPDLMQTTEFPE